MRRDLQGLLHHRDAWARAPVAGTVLVRGGRGVCRGSGVPEGSGEARLDRNARARAGAVVRSAVRWRREGAATGRSEERNGRHANRDVATCDYPAVRHATVRRRKQGVTDSPGGYRPGAWGCHGGRRAERRGGCLLKAACCRKCLKVVRLGLGCVGDVFVLVMCECNTKALNKRKTGPPKRSGHDRDAGLMLHERSTRAGAGEAHRQEGLLRPGLLYLECGDRYTPVVASAILSGFLERFHPRISSSLSNVRRS